jgi:NAD(P)H-dependent FMN reductase
MLDLLDFGLPLLDEPVPPSTAEQYAHAHTRRWAQAIEAADGFLFVTPEYNHAVPGALKNALDFVYREWNDKAAGFVSYGAAGGIRAVEQLRQVAGTLQLADVRAQVTLMLTEDFDADGRLAPRPFQRDSLAELVEQLTRWTHAMAALRRGVFDIPSRSPVAALVGPSAPRSGGEDAVEWADHAEALYPDFTGRAR